MKNPEAPTSGFFLLLGRVIPGFCHLFSIKPFANAIADYISQNRNNQVY